MTPQKSGGEGGRRDRQDPSVLPHRELGELLERQRCGDLRVRPAAAFRALAAERGLAEAYGATDVVVAAEATFTDQASLVLNLGPTDPPIRLREPQIAGVAALAGGVGGDLVLPIGGGDGSRASGAQALATLLAGGSVDLNAAGDPTPLQPRRELHTRLDLERIGNGRLLLHRGIVENGVVAVSSAEGVIHSAWGPLLGPFGNALFSASGADSIGLAMPGLALLGPGSPVLVGGGIGWVIGTGSAHQPQPRRMASGHARSPGAVAALSVDLHALDGRWVRACQFEGHGSALLVAVAAPIPLLKGTTALQAATPDAELEAPVLDVSIPRRIKPSFGGVSYAALKAGAFVVEGHRVPAAPCHSPRLALELAEELGERLRAGRFPLRLPLAPLSGRIGLVPLEA
jgi:uncharacterized protein (DUF39 family)